MDILRYYSTGSWNGWETSWPLWFPAWSHYFGPCDDDSYREWQLLTERVQKRANRRLEKKSKKAARAQGLKERNRMPGAWPI